MLYTEKVMDHFANPKNVGEIEDADGIGEVGNARCGDIMKIFIKVDHKNGIIMDIKFKTFGCAAAIATSSVATELVIGKTIEEALKISNETVIELLGGLPPVKIHCSVLAEEAIKSAVFDYYKRRGKHAGDISVDCDCCCDNPEDYCEGDDDRDEGICSKCCEGCDGCK